MNPSGDRTTAVKHRLDFDLHGVVGVRIVDALPKEAAAISAQLGGMVCPLMREPDILVRFVSHLSMPRLRYVEMGHSGFTDDDFFILSHRRSPVRVRMPLGQSKGVYEIVCEHGIRSIPLLEELIKLLAVRNGYAPVHASAFEYHGTGVLIAGWAHGGKTSCLLAFAHAGTRFISDDMVLLSGDGQTMLGLPTPISVSDWQIDQLPRIQTYIGRTRRLLFASVRGLERLQPRLGSRAMGGVLHTAIPALRRRLKVSIPAEAVFGQVGPCSAEPNKVFLTFSQAVDEIRVEPADPTIVAEQLATSFRRELLACFEQYLACRFAFPERRNELLESAESNAAELLQRALAGKEVFVVRHPHPVSLRELQRAMRPHVETRTTAMVGALQQTR